jgi:Piwi domain
MENKIALNFLPLNSQKFEFVIYRKLKIGNESKPDTAIKEYRLPISDEEDEKWPQYWISFYSTDGYKKFICQSHTNIFLTKMYLFWEIKNKSQNKIPSKIAKLSEDFYSKRIFFTIKEFEIGRQTIWIEPYQLKASNEFGFLIDFDFLKNDGVQFNIEVQKLSLSLDIYYKANRDYHSAKFDIIKLFINNFLPKINQLNDSLEISKKLKLIQPGFLQTKVYRFENGKESPSQFLGIKNKKPFKVLDGEVQYYFVVVEDQTFYARDLVKALSGKSFRTFDGLEKMFRSKFDVSKNSSNIKRIVIENYTSKEIDKVLSILEKETDNKIAIFLFPESEEEYYFTFKNKLLLHGIVSQGIHLETLKDENKLMWSISSLGLQVFAKLGGIPWRMKPSNDNCLIIGIGQAHHKSIDENGDVHIKKYFSYSVLMDSSGEYISMNMLAENDLKDNYLNDLNKKILEILTEQKEKYDKITIHIPYKIKHDEIEKIIFAAKQIKDDIEIVVLKISDSSKFFGYNSEHNSLIPYESSYIQLSHRDYLVWTEGLNYHNKKANKHYANPLHIDFFYTNKDRTEIRSDFYLQDILNLTGANWRGFNAKAIPISMFYPRIISKFIKNFTNYNLDVVQFNNLPPWFL